MVLSLAFGLIQLDATIVTVALTSIREQLGGSVSAAQWVVDGYTVPLAAGMLTAGAVGDRIGHRRVCALGFVVFGVASVACAVAPTVGMLIAARVLQGIGAASLLPSSLALVTLLFPEPAARARALGVWGGLAGCGFAAGPVLGGVLTQAFGWRAIFWATVPVCVVVGGLIRLWAAESPARDRRIDAPGAVLGAITLAALAAGIIRFGDVDGGPALPSVLVAVAVGAAVAFALTQRRRTEPMLPPTLFAAPPFGWAITVGFLFNFCLYGALLTVTLVLRSGFGLSPLRAGLAVLPLTLVVLVGATVSGFLTERLGARRPMVLGFVVAMVGAGIALVGGVTGSLALVVTGLTVLGGCSLAMPAMTSVAFSAAPESVRGLGSGALNTMRQIGGAIGIAALGAILAATSLSAGGLVPAMIAVVVAYVVAIVAALRATRS